ncbi:MAG: putative pyridoxal-dependent aspartate 1-decarboxylase [Proteobacteria bacterium]|nr:putative pyridoxal-dependent aspartate 1-decarboxylase [Pseudomonadota bacterium]
MTTKRRAIASLENMRKVFSIPEGDDSTLLKIEREISQNLLGFLRERIITGEMEPEDLEKDFQDVNIPEDPMFVSEQAQFLLDKVVAHSVHTASPSFIGHMTSSMPYFMLPLAKIMIALNQNTVKIETSKAFTPLESQVIGMLHHLVFKESPSFYARWTHDREHALGAFCSGGTVANLTGLWVARNLLLSATENFRSIRHDGLAAGLQAHNLSGMAILVSKRGHYSLRKAADVLGIGRNNLISLPTDHRNKCSISDLNTMIADLRKRRMGILAIVGIAGTTETGNVDPLDAMADICAQEQIYFHVDGAWGTPTLFSEKHCALLKGIERADSVVIDAHKQLYVPVGAGICLFKNQSALKSIETSAQYIIRKGSRDLGKHTLEGSRPGMAMLVHSGLRVLGRKGYEMLIDVGISKASQMAKLIQASDDFELTTEPELNLLTYRYAPAYIQTFFKRASPSQAAAANDLLSELTVNIQKTQRDNGKTFVSRTMFEVPSHNFYPLTVFRVVLANPLTTRQVYMDVLEEQRGIAIQEMNLINFNQRFSKIENL